MLVVFLIEPVFSVLLVVWSHWDFLPVLAYPLLERWKANELVVFLITASRWIIFEATNIVKSAGNLNLNLLLVFAIDGARVLFWASGLFGRLNSGDCGRVGAGDLALVVLLGIAAVSGLASLSLLGLGWELDLAADLFVNWHHYHNWLLWLGVVDLEVLDGWLDKLNHIWCSWCLQTDNWVLAGNHLSGSVDNLSPASIGSHDLLGVVLEAAVLGSLVELVEYPLWLLLSQVNWLCNFWLFELLIIW